MSCAQHTRDGLPSRPRSRSATRGGSTPARTPRGGGTPRELPGTPPTPSAQRSGTPPHVLERTGRPPEHKTVHPRTPTAPRLGNGQLGQLRKAPSVKEKVSPSPMQSLPRERYCGQTNMFPSEGKTRKKKKNLPHPTSPSRSLRALSALPASLLPNTPEIMLPNFICCFHYFKL